MSKLALPSIDEEDCESTSAASQAPPNTPNYLDRLNKKFVKPPRSFNINEGTYIRWLKEGPFEVFDVLNQVDETLAIVELSFEKDQVLYSGQKPTKNQNSLGRLESEYSIREGFFTLKADEIGGIVLDGFGRQIFPNWCTTGQFRKGKHQPNLTIADDDIPDSRKMCTMSWHDYLFAVKDYDTETLKYVPYKRTRRYKRKISRKLSMIKKESSKRASVLIKKHNLQ